MSERRIGAAKFKELCLGILDDLDPEGIVITKRGRPVARLIPIRTEPTELIGLLSGKLLITEAILSTGARWNAQP